MTKLLESGEMYLENILVLSKEKSNVRAIDIANYSGYSKPSVSRAIKILQNNNYINIDENSFITLTETGREKATKIFERHNILKQLFMSIGVSEQTAIIDACRIEHVISDETFSKLKAHADELSNKKGI